MTGCKETGPEVWYATDPVVRVDRSSVAVLQQRASTLPRERIRLCSHQDAQAAVHEMLIVHARGCYVRPHKHLNKDESFHIIEGEVDVVLLNEAGQVEELIRMGDYQSGRVFYYRLNKPLYHTLLIRSPQVVFHEVTGGPFRREDTLFLQGSPEIDDVEGAASYLANLETLLNEFCNP
jgi:cupin fold WbuC family metalloprotein